MSAQGHEAGLISEALCTALGNMSAFSAICPVISRLARVSCDTSNEALRGRPHV
jgi:hypothetical protein